MYVTTCALLHVPHYLHIPSLSRHRLWPVIAVVQTAAVKKPPNAHDHMTKHLRLHWLDVHLMLPVMQRLCQLI